MTNGPEITLLPWKNPAWSLSQSEELAHQSFHVWLINNFAMKDISSLEDFFNCSFDEVELERGEIM